MGVWAPEASVLRGSVLLSSLLGGGEPRGPSQPAWAQPSPLPGPSLPCRPPPSQVLPPFQAFSSARTLQGPVIHGVPTPK